MTGEEMQNELTAMLDPLDYPGDWSQRQREAYDARRYWLQAKLQDWRIAMDTLAKMERIEPLQQWRDLLERCRVQIADELRAIPPRQDMGRVRNLDYSLKVLFRGRNQVEGTGWCLETLRLGELLREAGYVESRPVENQMRGELPFVCGLDEADATLRALRQRRAEAQERLDIVMRESVPAPV
jgi:hypothetical protein